MNNPEFLPSRVNKVPETDKVPDDPATGGKVDGNRPKTGSEMTRCNQPPRSTDRIPQVAA
jgi:hypothetical protein